MSTIDSLCKSLSKTVDVLSYIVHVFFTSDET
nr:MAG TPA: hypothetical protein [Caudoviricetes sp.]